MEIKKIQQRLEAVGLKKRDSQKEMIETAIKALKKKQILCIEAPTGTGKTIAYCIAGVLAKAKNQTIVISTATIALQEQLIKKDLPLLSDILQQELKFALAKGRRRYVCPSRLFDPEQQRDLLDNDDTIERLQVMFDQHRWKGDRDSLDMAVPEAIWSKVSTDANGCAGKHCSFFEDCPFFKARKKMHVSDIIVANHSLLLSDLELGGGTLLPEPEKVTYIIDECHHLPDKALDHFAKFASVMGSVEWINNLSKVITKGVSAGYLDKQLPQNVAAITKDLVTALTAMRDHLNEHENKFEQDTWPVLEVSNEMQQLAENILTLTQAWLQQAELAHSTLELELEKLDRNDKERIDALNKQVANLSFIVNRAENLFATWELFCKQQAKGEAPVARWFEKREHYICHCSPINVSSRLRELFWNKVKNGVVLCSATVRALGKFDDYVRKVGLKSDERLMLCNIAAFFDYSRSVLFVPQMQYEPSGANAAKHIEEVIEMLPTLVLKEGGTLVLFTSRYAMEQTHQRCADKLRNDILMQDKGSKSKLVERHKNIIRGGRRSILFGLASFGEGLDLPADFCHHVIIHKLPFAVPATPIELTRSAWLSKNGLNSFVMSSLPAASIRLTQYVGRLVRQETDFGIVTILDKRLYNKGYGKQLLDNLPPFTRVINQQAGALSEIESIANLITEPA